LIFGRPFVKRFAMCYRTVVMSVLSCLSLCNVGVLWPKNGWTDQDETWRPGTPQPWPHCVRWGPSSSSPKGHSRQFSAHICCGQMAAWMKMPLGTEVGLCPDDIVLDGTQLPLPKGGEASKFSAHVYCGQTAGCITMPLGMKVGLSPEDFVFDGDPAPLPKKGAEPPIFGPYLLRPNGCMDQDATWYGGRPRPTRHCVRWDTAPLTRKGAKPPPQFSAHFYCGQTAECIKMRLGMEVGLSLGDFVLDGDPARLPQKGHSPQFSANVRCGQTAGWMKTPLGMEVDIRPDHIVLDGVPALHERAQQPSALSYC